MTAVFAGVGKERNEKCGCGFEIPELYQGPVESWQLEVGRAGPERDGREIRGRYECGCHKVDSPLVTLSCAFRSFAGFAVVGVGVGVGVGVDRAVVQGTAAFFGQGYQQVIEPADEG